MKNFNYSSPVEIIFGRGTFSQIGEIAARYGKNALLVTGPKNGALKDLYIRAYKILQENGIHLCHFDGVIPNPTTDVVTAGAVLAKENKVELVIGIGGGSALDAAKAIAVEATHSGTAWDYLHYKEGPTEKTLPIIAVGTTAGTGSQTTPCAVITNPANKDKSAIWHKNIFPRVAIVDPELTDTLPAKVTAETGFDAFCHNFEAFLSVNSNPMSETLALDAIARIMKYLPVAYNDPLNKEARDEMAWADTLGGLTNAASGVTLPHGLGMQIGGLCPWISHGQALAAQYPSFTRYTMPLAKEKFARVALTLDPEMSRKTIDEAAVYTCERIDDLLHRINLWINLKDLKMSPEEVREAANRGQVLGDYKNNPRVATIEEMYSLLMESYNRE